MGGKWELRATMGLVSVVVVMLAKRKICDRQGEIGIKHGDTL